jgi:tRNA1Val (adenine37-N6)-methyltransferase
LSKFRFKEFSIQQDVNTHKVGTDAMLLGAYIDASRQSLGLDIGAGTGVLSLMLAQRNPTIQITCIEIDEKSSDECTQNVNNSPWFNRIKTIHADFTQYHFEQNFDLIFTNPPYYLTDNSSNESNERTKHITPESLLNWLNKIANLLTIKGEFWMIWPSETSQKIIEIAHDSGLHVAKKITVYSKKNKLSRNILCFSREKKEGFNDEQFIIRNHDNSYSDAYLSLTSDFHNTEFNA